LFDVWAHFNQKSLASGRETGFLYSDFKKLLTNCFLLTKLDLNGKNIIRVKLTHNQKVKCVYRKVVSYFTMDGEKKIQKYSLLLHNVAPYYQRKVLPSPFHRWLPL
jgi:hypothetical protein